MFELPARFENLLKKNIELHGYILSSFSNLLPWFKDNKTVFFPEYTDHGETHLKEVIATAESIISDGTWDLLTAEDVAAIVAAVLLHDCAMHLTEDSFYTLIRNGYPKAESRYFSNDPDWAQLWTEFLSEAKRFDDKKLKSLFDDTAPVKDIPLKKIDLTLRDRLLIGEFIRRHHARLAHEISLIGIPAFSDEKLKLADISKEYADLFGLIARSHNMNIRAAVDKLETPKKRLHLNVHTPFVMMLLRISDYIQIHSPRAPKELLKIKTLISPVSRSEWAKHHAIVEITHEHDDPEAIYVDAEPKDALTFMGLKNLFLDIQKELDLSWAILGETYGMHEELRNLGISVRRIRSSLDDLAKFKKDKRPTFIPKVLKFKTSDARMMELLISPLYGDEPQIGIRELVQNSVDACLELEDLVKKNSLTRKPERSPDVTVTLIDNEDEGGTVIVEDYGIGMTLDVVENYFLNIGASFRNCDEWKKAHETEGHSNVQRTGRFGVGLLAAYLLGDELEVTTRYIDEKDSQAIRFKCKRGDDSITVAYTDFHHGTRIEIKVTKEIKDALLDTSAWDWYTLAAPKVSRKVIKNGTERILDQSLTLPNVDAPLDGSSWHRIQADGFDDVLWAFKNDTSRYRYARDHLLVCNGIYITDYLELEGLKLSPGSPSLQTYTPQLVVFDPDGKFPINLQRNGLTSKRLPFDTVLEQSIAENIVEQLVNVYQNIQGPISGAMLNSVMLAKIEGLDFSYLDEGFSRFVVTRNGLLPLDYVLFSMEKPKEVYIDAGSLASNKGAWRSEEFCKSASYYLMANNVTETKQSQVQWVRNVLSENYGYYRNNAIKNFQSSKKRILIRKERVQALVHTVGNVPKTLWRTLQKEWENDKWELLSSGNPPAHNLNLEKICAELESSNSFGFAAYYYNWEAQDKKEKSVSSPFADAWLKRVKTPILPFKKEEK